MIMDMKEKWTMRMKQIKKTDKIGQRNDFMVVDNFNQHYNCRCIVVVIVILNNYY